MISRKLNLSELRSKLKRKEPAIGSWIQTGSAEVAEILADAGYDWIMIDMEHGSISLNNLPDLIRSILLHQSIPLVRVIEGNPSNCKGALDAGAAGILIPDVRSAKQLKDVISWCAWPPAGIRGVGFSRANLYGKYFEQYKEEAQQPFIVAQIEHVEAINNLNEILDVRGLDAVFIGPYDLSASLGITGLFDHKDYIEIIDKFENIMKKSKIVFGIHVVHPDEKMLREKIESGYLFNGYGTDAMFLIESSHNPLKVQ